MLNFVVAFVTVAFAQERLAPITVNTGFNKQGSAESLDYGQMRARFPTKLEDGVGPMPNVEFTGGPRAEAQSPQIRGLNAERILILEDGVRQNFQSGHNGRVFGDYSLLENVEVAKGPWSSLYGSGAMGGAISFRRSLADDLVRRTGLDHGLQVALDTASANSGFGQRVTGFAKAGALEPLLSVRQSKSQDVRLGDGSALAYSSSQTFDVYSAMTYRPSAEQNFTLKLNRYEDRADVTLNPEQPLSPTNVPGQERILKSDAVGDYNIGGAGWDFHARPYYRETSIRKVRRSDSRTDIQQVGTWGVDLWNNWRREIGTFTLGAEYYEDHTTGRRGAGELASFPDGQGRQLGLYAQPSFKFGRLTLTPGLRYDSYKIEDNGDDHLSGKAYAEYEYLRGLRAFVSWGQAFNAPRLQDLYVSGMHFPGNFFIANPELKPERADTWEAGGKNDFILGDDQTLVLNGTYFRTEARDFIAREVNFAGGTTQFRNRDKVRLEGYELSALYQRTRWGVGLSYGQTRSLDKGTGQPLPDTAADQLLGSLQYYPEEGWAVGTQTRYAFDQHRVPTGTAETPGYFTQDFYLTFTRGRWDARLRLENAFDRDYRPHVSAIKATGRDLRANLAYTF